MSPPRGASTQPNAAPASKLHRSGISPPSQRADRLFHDAHRLPRFSKQHPQPRVTIAFLLARHVEIELFVTRIGLRAAQIADQSRCARDRAEQTVSIRVPRAMKPTSSNRSRKLLEMRSRCSSSFNCFERLLRLAERSAAGIIRQVAQQPARCEQAEQIAMAGEFARNAQQILLQNSGLTVGNDQGRRLADFLNRAGMLSQAFEFGQKYAQERARAPARSHRKSIQPPGKRLVRERRPSSPRTVPPAVRLHPPFCPLRASRSRAICKTGAARSE